MPLERQEIHGFLGVNLRKDRTSLEDSEMARAINGDFHAQTGTVVLRLPKSKLFSSALTDLVIRRLARVNGLRYQVAGQSVYRDQVKILDGVLSPNLITTITPFRPLQDTTLWAFIADDAVMRKASGSVARNWGVVAPTDPPSATPAAQGGALLGSYTAVYTYIRFDGTTVAHESNPSPASAAVTLNPGALALGNIVGSTDPQVNGIGIYRSVADGTLHLLDARLSISDTSEFGLTYDFESGALPSTALQFFWPFPRETHLLGFGQLSTSQGWEDDGTDQFVGTSEDPNGYRATSLWERAAYVTAQTRYFTYTSTLADESLGAEVERDNDPPPLASWANEFQGHMFLTRDAANKDHLWWSKRFRPEAVPVANFIRLGTPDDPLQCAIPMAGLLGVFSRRTKYRVSGSSTTGFVGQEALSARGTPAPMACIPTEYGIVFPARDGVFRTNLVAADEEISASIAAIFQGEAINDFNPVNWDAASTMAAAFYKGKYFLSLPTGTSTTPDIMAVYSSVTSKWYFFDHPARSLYREEDTDKLLAGFGDGLVYVLEDATATESTSVDWQSKDYFGASLEVRKLFQWVKVDADAQGDSITASVYVDGVVKRTVALSGTRGKALIALPGGCIGYTWRIRLTYTGGRRIRWYGAEALWAPLEAA